MRVFYAAQTFYQLRKLIPLTLDAPPATQQLLIPGGSKSDKYLDVEFGVFEKIVRQAILEKDAQNPATEMQPSVLTGVPRQ